LLRGGSGIDTANLFSMGEPLGRMTEMSRRTGHTNVFAHHTKRRQHSERFRPTTLEDLTMAGFAEWARQWLLLSRRCEFNNDGLHDLWFNVGGSEGHGGSYVLTIDEGTYESGWCWDCTVEHSSEAIERDKSNKVEQREVSLLAAAMDRSDRVLTLLRNSPEGLTASGTAKPLKMNNDKVNEALEDLIERRLIEKFKHKKQGQPERNYYRALSNATE
jgi:hypothetical protein